MPAAELVEFPAAGGVTLHGFLYRPLSANGKSPSRFPALIWNHGSEKMPGQQAFLAKFYVDHGFVFFIPHRRGHGRSADAGTWVGDLTSQSGNDNPKFRAHIHEVINNEDVIPAVNWLKQQPFVDPQRIIMSGVSYGGIQTILTAGKDPGIRAYVPFAPGAMSWGNPELQQLLIAAVKKARAPIFLIQARGDYNLGPSTTLPAYFLGHSKLSQARLYDQFGCSQADAHGKFATWQKGIAIWGADVLKFITDALR